MDTKLTQDDYKNILALIAQAQIKGRDAILVAVLIQKINNLIIPIEKEVDTKEKK